MSSIDRDKIDFLIKLNTYSRDDIRTRLLIILNEMYMNKMDILDFVKDIKKILDKNLFYKIIDVIIACIILFNDEYMLNYLCSNDILNVKSEPFEIDDGNQSFFDSYDIDRKTYDWHNTHLIEPGEYVMHIAFDILQKDFHGYILDSKDSIKYPMINLKMVKEIIRRKMNLIFFLTVGSPKNNMCYSIDNIISSLSDSYVFQLIDDAMFDGKPPCDNITCDCIFESLSCFGKAIVADSPQIVIYILRIHNYNVFLKYKTNEELIIYPSDPKTMLLDDHEIQFLARLPQRFNKEDLDRLKERKFMLEDKDKLSFFKSPQANLKINLIDVMKFAQKYGSIRVATQLMLQKIETT